MLGNKWYCVFLVILLVSPLFTGIVVAADPGYDTIQYIHDSESLRIIFGVIFGLWDLNKTSDLADTWGIKSTASGMSVLVVYLFIWLIIFMFISDALFLFSPLSSQKLGWVVGAALTIITAQLNGIYYISSKAIVILGWFGAVSVVWGIATSIIMFILLSWGSTWAREFALRRQIGISKAKALAGRAKAKEGLDTLKSIGGATESAVKDM